MIFALVFEAQVIRPLSGNHVHGIMDQVDKHPAQAMGIQRHLDIRRLVFKFQLDGLELDHRAQFANQILNVITVIDDWQGRGAARTLRKIQNCRQSIL